MLRYVLANDKGKYKEGTRNTELVMMAKQKDDFCEKDIVTRKKAIIDAFIGYLEQNELTIRQRYISIAESI